MAKRTGSKQLKGLSSAGRLESSDQEIRPSPRHKQTVHKLDYLLDWFSRTIKSECVKLKARGPDVALLNIISGPSGAILNARYIFYNLSFSFKNNS